MKVCDTPSVRLTKKGDSLAGTVARVKDYISRHQIVNTDLVLLAGMNDLSGHSVSQKFLSQAFKTPLLSLKNFLTSTKSSYVKFHLVLTFIM